MTRRWAIGALMATLVAAPVLAQRGPGGPGGFRGGFGGGFGGGMLLTTPEVQRELKMDPAQVDLVNQVLAESRQRGGGEEFRNLTLEERRQRFAAANAEQQKKLAEILDAKQMARLKQLSIQQAGYNALAQPDVANTLKLTPAQRQSVEQTLRAQGEAMRALFESVRSQGGGGEGFAAVRPKMEEARRATDARLAAVLTDAQKKQFESMKGAPFTFPQRQGGPRRGNN